jgi:RNA-directed DNA polymerase
VRRREVDVSERRVDVIVTHQCLHDRQIDAGSASAVPAIVLKHWRRRRTIAHNLVALGVKRHSAWRGVYAGRKSTWALSHSPAVDNGLRVAYFTQRGLIRLVDLHRRSRQNIIAPIQPQLALGWG